MNKQKVKVVRLQVERHIPLFAKTCPVCGTHFDGIKKARYCSVNCANKASYQRNSETRRKRRMERYYTLKQDMAGRNTRVRRRAKANANVRPE